MCVGGGEFCNINHCLRQIVIKPKHKVFGESLILSFRSKSLSHSWCHLPYSYFWSRLQWTKMFFLQTFIKDEKNIGPCDPWKHVPGSNCYIMLIRYVVSNCLVSVGRSINILWNNNNKLCLPLNNCAVSNFTSGFSNCYRLLTNCSPSQKCSCYL